MIWQVSAKLHPVLAYTAMVLVDHSGGDSSWDPLGDLGSQGGGGGGGGGVDSGWIWMASGRAWLDLSRF